MQKTFPGPPRLSRLAPLPNSAGLPVGGAFYFPPVSLTAERPDQSGLAKYRFKSDTGESPESTVAHHKRKEIQW